VVVEMPIPQPAPVAFVETPPPAPPPEPATEVPQDIPQAWLDKLAEEAIVARSFVEAAAHVLRLEVGKYRQALLSVEDELRAALASPPPAGVQEGIFRLISLNRLWLTTQSEATGHLSSRLENLGQFTDLARSLETVLVEQAAQIETTCSNLQLLNVSGDPAGAGEALLDELMRLMNLAHALRDRVAEAIVAIMRADNRLSEIDKSHRQDDLTALRSRAGLEVALADWWREDPARQRLASVALLDISAVGQFNRQHGTRWGDRLIAAVGSLVDGLIRKDRGYDVAGRISGQRLMLLWGDTGPRNATSATERLRQTISTTTIEHGDIQTSIHVSCAVTEIFKTDDVLTLLRRLDGALAEAKRQGATRTLLDEGHGPIPIDPPDFHIKPRNFRLEEKA
jgi:diguanylate cyclase (GGDEF)-like protein